ncbi:GNAT family N-acetyltransferase [Microbacterium sp. 1.5R]|uniref:GNAT family N-acetyltransferase n=1 Tax=Microbacterium sp. 1.5R TaxID=1916917 RepID=UPI001C92C3DE|nr:GNAT family N-acetyltransferase [Microbacterium sp. 1.5R]
METLTLRPWSEGDLPLLRAANTAAMTAHLNGPESERQVLGRHQRYLGLDDRTARMFVVIADRVRPVGAIGYWTVEWRDEPAFETGWFVVPAAQGKGVASRALALLIDDARAHPAGLRHLVAFPAVENAASNGVCRRAGFERASSLAGEFRGSELTMNVWELDLHPHRARLES